MQFGEYVGPFVIAELARSDVHRLGHPHCQRLQDVGLPAGDPAAEQRRDVAIAAVFPQQRGEMPQPGDRVDRLWQRPVRGEQRPTLERRRLGGAGACTSSGPTGPSGAARPAKYPIQKLRYPALRNSLIGSGAK